MAKAPNVFLSYSHDSKDHKKWVEKLAIDLRKNGIDAIFDQWEVGLGDDIAAFMERGVTEANRVIVVCSPNYVTKANAGEGGVGYEKMIVTAELVKNLGTNKFIPLIRGSGGEKKVPVFLGARLYIDFDDDDKYDDKLLELLREIHEQPVSEKPPLGASPFLHSADTQETEATERKVGEEFFFDEQWIERERADAASEFAKVEFPGSLEIWFSLEQPKIKADQAQLLEAARAAQIDTFGWPIGVILENRDECRPRPRQDGIFANISIINDRASYDYWAIRTNGDVYLLKSLFEDSRQADKLFFNTRIVRTTEALLYCHGLYSTLGADDNAHVRFCTRYRGLKGRELSASSPKRHLYERKTEEDEVQVCSAFVLKDVKENPVKIVQELLEPVFMLFDFFKLSDEVYADIVNKFINGEVT